MIANCQPRTSLMGWAALAFNTAPMVIVVRPRTLWLGWTSASVGPVLSASMLTAQDSVLACIGATVRTVEASKVRRTIAASLAWFRRVIFQTVTTILSHAGYSSLSIPG